MTQTEYKNIHAAQRETESKRSAILETPNTQHNTFNGYKVDFFYMSSSSFEQVQRNLCNKSFPKNVAEL